MTAYTDKLIEAMARSICGQATVDDGYSTDSATFYLLGEMGIWKNHIAQARAALIAQLKFMIEHGPSERQLDGARDWSLRKKGLGVGNHQATGCYQAMCRALLAELEGT